MAKSNFVIFYKSVCLVNKSGDLCSIDQIGKHQSGKRTQTLRSGDWKHRNPFLENYLRIADASRQHGRLLLRVFALEISSCLHCSNYISDELSKGNPQGDTPIQREMRKEDDDLESQ